VDTKVLIIKGEYQDQFGGEEELTTWI